jgi:hypothetical protein
MGRLQGGVCSSCARRALIDWCGGGIRDGDGAAFGICMDLAEALGMPRNFHQGLFFMLGFLLAFYVLLPLIGVKV